MGGKASGEPFFSRTHPPHTSTSTHLNRICPSYVGVLLGPLSTTPPFIYESSIVVHTHLLCFACEPQHNHELCLCSSFNTCCSGVWEGRPSAGGEGFTQRLCAAKAQCLGASSRRTGQLCGKPRSIQRAARGAAQAPSSRCLLLVLFCFILDDCPPSVCPRAPVQCAPEPGGLLCLLVTRGWCRLGPFRLCPHSSQLAREPSIIARAESTLCAAYVLCF